jgi:hydrogenase maturation factor
MSVRCWSANQREIKKWENIIKRRHPKGGNKIIIMAVDGGDSHQIWKVAANMLNKQSRTLTRGDPPAWGLGLQHTARTSKVNELRGSNVKN